MARANEQPHRAVPEDVVRVLDALRRHIERRDPVDVLAGDAQRLAAGRQTARAGAGAQQRLGHAGRRLDHVLAVVEDQQELLGADRARDTLGRHGARSEREAERARHGGRDELGIDKRPSSATHTPSGNLGRRWLATSRPSRVLPMPPAPTRLTSRCSVASGRDFCELGLSADQFRNRLRKVRHPRGSRTGGRGRRRADLAGELIAAPGHRADEVAIGAEHLSERGDLGRPGCFLRRPGPARRGS